jgi:two-component system NtrC family sensor kinase
MKEVVSISASDLQRRYKLTLFLGVMLLIVAIFSYTWTVVLSEREALKNSLQKQGQQLQFLLHEKINIARFHVAAMRRTVERGVSQPELVDAGMMNRLNRVAAAAAPIDAPWDSLPVSMASEVGSLLIDPHSHSDKNFKRNLNATLTMLPQVVAMHGQQKMFQWSYYYSQDKTWTAIFPEFSRAEVFKQTKASNMRGALDVILDEANTAPLRMAGPEFNPARTTVWIAPYFDFAGKGMMVSLLAPVYHLNEYVGAVGTDVTLAFLDALLLTQPASLGRTMIVDSAGFLLADSGQSLQSAKTILRIADVIPQYSSDKIADDLQSMRFPLQDTPWTLILYVPNAEINTHLLVVSRPFIAMALILLVAFLALAWIQNRRYTIPALQLVEYLDLVDTKPDTAPPKVPAIWHHWFDSVGKTALERRELLARTMEHAILLEGKVESRTLALSMANDELLNTIEILQKTQKQLVRSEKMASLGAMVAGVAHELNTPLGNALLVITTIRDSQQQMANQLAQGLRRADLEQFLLRLDQAGDVLQRNVQIAGNLVQRFKEVAVNQTNEQHRSFNLHEATACIAIVLGPMTSRVPCIVLNETPPDIVMDSYPGAIEQIFTNLISNACNHAFEGSKNGVVRIDAAYVTTDQIVVTVSDNGTGITPENLPHIFDPFFTTKMGRGGTGLGLHIVLNIVENILGGTIEVISTSDGTQFVMTLPRISPYSAPPEDNSINSL